MKNFKRLTNKELNGKIVDFYDFIKDIDVKDIILALHMGATIGFENDDYSITIERKNKISK